eukprot:1162100-Pelagomonas_calceolata.AAC.8
MHCPDKVRLQHAHATKQEVHAFCRAFEYFWHIEKEVRAFSVTSAKSVRSCIVVGGVSMQEQRHDLKAGAEEQWFDLRTGAEVRRVVEEVHLPLNPGARACVFVLADKHICKRVPGKGWVE